MLTPNEQQPSPSSSSATGKIAAGGAGVAGGWGDQLVRAGGLSQLMVLLHCTLMEAEDPSCEADARTALLAPLLVINIAVRIEVSVE